MPLDDRTTGPAFSAASRSASAAPERRGSEMVERDRPHPAPRPSPELSDEVDRAAFDAAWDREAREARREAFKAQRMQTYSPEHSKTFNRRAVRQPT